jgi:hypothetical protein
MTDDPDDPGNSSQNATIRHIQGLRAASEVRILARAMNGPSQLTDNQCGPGHNRVLAPVFGLNMFDILD